MKAAGKVMAQRNGKREVWVNIGVPTKIVSVTIEYDQSGGSISQNFPNLTTEFTRGYFKTIEAESRHNEKVKRWRNMEIYAAAPGDSFIQHGFGSVSGSEIQYHISEHNTVKYDIPDLFRDTKALYIKDTTRDFSSISVFFTDYAPSTTVYPKMSQPGKSLLFDLLFQLNHFKNFDSK